MVSLGGLGDLVSGGKHLVDKGLEVVEDGVEAGKRIVGTGIDKGTDLVGEGLDRVGAEGWADSVTDWGDDTASSLGAKVGEQQLGQTEEAEELVHGKPARLRETAAHLADFHAAFDRVGQGLRRLDSGQWKGETGNAFREKLGMQPTQWLHAADACRTAASALGRYAETVTWAQGQAKEAIALYKRGTESSDKARAAHSGRVEAYEAAVRAGREPGPDPGPFTDPGEADRQHARDLLREARRQRDEAGAAAEQAVRQAMAHAPQEPPPTDRMAAAAMDGYGALSVETTHVLGGVIKGTAGLLNFVRGLNPVDPYNLTHPAEYLQNVNMTLAGVVSTAAHPERIPGALIDSFEKDPSEGVGRLLPELLGTKGFGAARTGVRVAAREGVEEAVEVAAKTGPTKWEFLSQPTAHVSERAIHADSVAPARAQQFLNEEFPWLKDVNQTGAEGYTQNCSRNVIAVDRRMDGIEAYADPLPAPEHVRPHELGLPDRPVGKYDIVESYDDLIKDLNQRGDDARSVVYISRSDGSAHVFNAVKTPHGVVFLDGQSGTLARLEQNAAKVGHIPYR